MKKIAAVLLSIAIIVSLAIIVSVTLGESAQTLSAEISPETGDIGIIIALAVLVATTIVTVKMTRDKNRI